MVQISHHSRVLLPTRMVSIMDDYALGRDCSRRVWSVTGTKVVKLA